jgi:ADP-heptose:LPS heptosyltransferase
VQPDALATTQRILVVRADNVGDVVLTGPLFRALRQARPDAVLGLLASPAGAEAAPLLPWVDEVTSWRPVWQDLGHRMPLDPAREQELIRRLAADAWDAIVIATSFNQTAWPAAYAAYLAGIPVRVGFEVQFGGSVLSHPVTPPPDEVHQAERNLSLLRAIGVPIADEALEISIPPAARVKVTDRLATSGLQPRDPIVFVPGASAPARRMDASRLAEAAATAIARTGRPVVVATTPRERALRDAILAATPDALSIGDDLSVPEYAALIDAAAAVVCGNSSALHLADALGRPVVATYAGTDRWSQWQPRAATVQALSVDVACSPCYRIECPIGNACLALDPGAIAEAVVDVMASQSSGARSPRLAEPVAVH